MEFRIFYDFDANSDNQLNMNEWLRAMIVSENYDQIIKPEDRQ